MKKSINALTILNNNNFNNGITFSEFVLKFEIESVIPKLIMNEKENFKCLVVMRKIL